MFDLDLGNLNLEELKELKQKISLKIKEIETKNSNSFEFEFLACNDPRKGTPYVAILSFKNDKIERDFFDLHKEYGKNSVTVSGKYRAKSGEIIEQREGGSWKNDYRYWYLVSVKGELLEVADINNSNQKLKVSKYLAGEIDLERLLENN